MFFVLYSKLIGLDTICKSVILYTGDYETYYTIYDRISNGDSLFTIFFDLTKDYCSYRWYPCWYIEPCIAVKFFGLNWKFHILFRIIICILCALFLYLFARKVGSSYAFSSLFSGLVLFGTKNDMAYCLPSRDIVALLITSIMLFLLAKSIYDENIVNKVLFLVFFILTAFCKEAFTAQLPCYILLYIVLYRNKNKISIFETFKRQKNELLFLTAFILGIFFFIVYNYPLNGGNFGGGIQFNFSELLHSLFQVIYIHKAIILVVLISLIVSLVSNKKKKKEILIYTSGIAISCLIFFIIHSKRAYVPRYTLTLFLPLAFSICVLYNSLVKNRFFRFCIFALAFVCCLHYSIDGVDYAKKDIECIRNHQNCFETLLEIANVDDVIWFEMGSFGERNTDIAYQRIAEYFGYKKGYIQYANQLIDVYEYRESPITAIPNGWYTGSTSNTPESMVYNFYGYHPDCCNLKAISDADVIVTTTDYVSNSFDLSMYTAKEVGEFVIYKKTSY